MPPEPPSPHPLHPSQAQKVTSVQHNVVDHVAFVFGVIEAEDRGDLWGPPRGQLNARLPVHSKSRSGRGRRGRKAMSGTQKHHTHTPCQQSYGDTLPRWVTQNYSGSSCLLSTSSSVIRAMTEHSSAVLTSLREILLLGWAQGKLKKKETPHFIFENSSCLLNIRAKSLWEWFLITLRKLGWFIYCTQWLFPGRRGGRGKGWVWESRKVDDRVKMLRAVVPARMWRVPSLLHPFQNFKFYKLQCLIKMDETQSLMGKVLFLLTSASLWGNMYTCQWALVIWVSTSLSSKVTYIFIYKTTEPH